MKKLVCDRCGLEIKEKEELYLALEGQKAWEMAARARGTEPRGIIPCKNFVSCGGEMIFVNERRLFRRRK